ncbi:type II secretion system F domain protein [Streptococcus ictaluri 707-05]|uniref:Type II secretion system F domain protein n=2 Tax=Streptococcus ictaluri TaxID=380397 RepID=G5K4K8_9STRE|nr:type II secretion system F domain protein [Streptococcus ictaluri 707-05]
METSLLKGEPLADMLASLGFSEGIITQVNLADSHGNLGLTLQKVGDYLKQVLLIRRKIVEVATYPLILFVFLIAIMLGLRHYLIPQLTIQNRLTYFLMHFPEFFLASLALVALMVLAFLLRWRRQARLQLVSRFSRWPIFGYFLKHYLTAYYAKEWGNLIGQGLELQSLLAIMAQEKSQLMRELAKDMQSHLLSGKSFHQQVAAYPFFKKELGLIIEYGDMKSKLGYELEVYARESWSRFFSQLHQATQLIQPLIFLLVALIIVVIYAAILLPIYQNMGDVF